MHVVCHINVGFLLCVCVCVLNFIFIFKNFIIGVELLYNVVFISALEQIELAICVHISSPS